MFNGSDNQYQNTSLSSNDEWIINFDEIVKISFKNKKLIALLTFIGFLFSVYYSFNKQNIYSGQFQILIKRSNNFSLSQTENSQLGASSLISSLTGGNNQLSTEIEIIKSPSVLAPVFEFVKERKSLSGINVEKMKFSSWFKNNMEVEQVTGTNVLDLTYKDTDKDIIMPTLEMISKTYQEYSGRNRSEGLNKGLNYLKSQINKYKQLSSISLQESTTHAKENDLIPIPQSSLSLDSRISELTQNNIEVIRVNAANDVKTLERQLFEIENRPTDDKLTPYLFLNKLTDDSIIQSISRIETQIINLKTYLKGEDQDLLRLINEKNKLEVLLKEKIIKALKSELNLAKARLEASERPIDVLTKYDELIGEAILNYKTFRGLKEDLIRLELEKARNEDPWEIITNPTVLNEPIAPNKQNLILIGSALSVFFAISIVVLINKLKGKIFLTGDIERILGISSIQEFSIKNPEKIEENIKLMSSNPNLFKENSSVAFLFIGDIKNEIVDQFRSSLESSLSSKKFIFTKNLLESEKMDTQFLIFKKGLITKNELLDLKQKIALQNNLTSGLLILDD